MLIVHNNIGGTTVIEKHTSINGIRIVLEEVPHVRSVSIGVWVFTGSRDEIIEENGISHFIEHMLFKGTKTRTAQQIAEAFESIGGQVNAFTSKEYTCYYARVLDTYKEFAIDILSDMFFHSTFQEDELVREKKVVLEEVKMYEDTPDDVIHDLLADASFQGHSLGRTIIGTEQHIKAFSKEKIIAYMDEKYTPNNVVISVAGNVDSSFIPMIEDHFNQFTNDQQPKKSIKPPFTNNHLTRNKEVEQAHLCYGFEGLSVQDEYLMSMNIVNNILGGGMNSRLFQEIREKQGLAYSVFSFHQPYVDSGLLTIYAGVNKSELSLLEKTIEVILEQLVADGLTEKEIQHSKQRLKGSLVLGLENTSSRMHRNGRNELLMKRHRTIDEMMAEIDLVDSEKTRFVIDQVLNGNRSSALILPN